jgi:hypothetical protein
MNALVLPNICREYNKSGLFMSLQCWFVAAIFLIYAQSLTVSDGNKVSLGKVFYASPQ